MGRDERVRSIKTDDQAGTGGIEPGGQRAQPFLDAHCQVAALAGQGCHRVAAAHADVVPHAPGQAVAPDAGAAGPGGERVEEAAGGRVDAGRGAAHDPVDRREGDEEASAPLLQEAVQVPGTVHLGREHLVDVLRPEVADRPLVEPAGEVDDAGERARPAPLRRLRLPAQAVEIGDVDGRVLDAVTAPLAQRAVGVGPSLRQRRSADHEEARVVLAEEAGTELDSDPAQAAGDQVESAVREHGPVETSRFNPAEHRHQPTSIPVSDLKVALHCVDLAQHAFRRDRPVAGRKVDVLAAHPVELLRDAAEQAENGPSLGDHVVAGHRLGVVGYYVQRDLATGALNRLQGLHEVDDRMHPLPQLGPLLTGPASGSAQPQRWTTRDTTVPAAARSSIKRRWSAGAAGSTR